MPQSTTKKKPNKRYEKVVEAIKHSVETYEDKVVLTKQEMAKSAQNKKELHSKESTFANARIYRPLHATMRLLIEIVARISKKNVKLTDILLTNFSEVARWTAAAYHHSDVFLKINAIEEAISLLYVVKITINSMSNLVGEKKHRQLITSCDVVMRQLVAWRSSLTSRGSDDDAQ